MKSIYELFKENAFRYPEKLALVVGNKKLKYKELLKEVEIISSALAYYGVSK